MKIDFSETLMVAVIIFFLRLSRVIACRRLKKRTTTKMSILISFKNISESSAYGVSFFEEMLC